MVELFRLLIIYLQEHRVSIGVAVEVSIVSVLREIIVRGVLETPWVQVVATCLFLMVLGALLVVRAWIPPTFDGVDPEQIVSRRHRLRFAQDLPPIAPQSNELADSQAYLSNVTPPRSISTPRGDISLPS